jgi:hypothetical protein
MLPSLNFSRKDPKFTLLAKVFKYIDNKNTMRIYSRNGVKNIPLMVVYIKILFVDFILIIPYLKSLMR